MNDRKQYALVGLHDHDTKPRYMVFGGIVFVPLTRQYLKDSFGSNWTSRAPIRLVERTWYGTRETPGQEVVVLSQVLTHDRVNFGYSSSCDDSIVESVNDERVRNLQHLCELIDASISRRDEFIKFIVDMNKIIVIDVAEALAAESAILNEHHIPSSRSAVL